MFFLGDELTDLTGPVLVGDEVTVRMSEEIDFEIPVELIEIGIFKGTLRAIGPNPQVEWNG